MQRPSNPTPTLTCTVALQFRFRAPVPLLLQCCCRACCHPRFPRKAIILCGHSAACHFRGESTLCHCRCGDWEGRGCGGGGGGERCVVTGGDSRGRPEQEEVATRIRQTKGTRGMGWHLSLEVANPGTDRQIGHILRVERTYA